MPDYRKYYDSNYIQSCDIDGDVVVTIKVAKREKVGRDKTRKLVLFYEEFEKGHAIPKRDVAPVIARVLGSKIAEDWYGKKITLYVEKGSWFGGAVDEAIRVHPVAPGEKS